MSVQAINGFEMWVDDSGAGEPLLLLHGFTGAGGDWVHAGRDLLGRGRRLIVPDLRGHGRSTNPAGTITHRQCAADVLALLDRLGIQRCDAVGLSLGGNTLLHVATQQPDRVRAIVVAAATTHYPRQAREIMAALTVDSRGEAEWQEMRARHAHGVEQIRALWRQANAFKDDYDDLAFTPPSLARIRARTPVVLGDRDPLYPVEIAVEMYRAIPRASLFVVPDAGHDAIFGPMKGAFVDAAVRFLSG